MNKEQLYMVFDVESIGLHGEGFAVGWVVVNGMGVEVQHGLAACDPNTANGTASNREWVSENIPPIESLIPCDYPKAVRDAFWQQWTEWKTRGAILVADCAWPVEARFLARCVDDEPIGREWQGPYPLHDLGSILLAFREDPLQKFHRLETELPEHNPLADARQSARILCSMIASQKPHENRRT